MTPKKKTPSKKTKKPSLVQQLINPKLALALALLTLVVVGVALFFNNNNGPNYVKRVYYGRVARQAYSNEYKNIAPALKGLGIAERKDLDSVCRITPIATDGINVSDVLFCGLESNNYVKVDPSNKANIIGAAKQLDGLVKKYGGTMSTNATGSFDKYFTDITNGIDYYPDISVKFVRGNYLCAVSVNVAYANPNPPAYSIQFGCNAPRVTKEDIYLYPYPTDPGV